MPIPDLTSAVWRKSSYSGTDANCVEVAVLGNVTWHKSSHSGASGDCVEVASLECCHAVRDSKDPHGPALAFSSAAWQAFIADVKDGAFPAI